MKRLLFPFIYLILMSNISIAQTYKMPDESEPHEGTWLQWPHQYEYGTTYRNSLDATWVAMTAALVANEKVHIIAYNSTEQTRITGKLTTAGVSLANVDFKIHQTNDVWIRDNGPIFVRNATGNLVVQDWGFNGWGGKFNSTKCNPIPTSVATDLGLTVLNLNSIMTNEGGAIELDGNGVLMATKSSIISQSPTNSVRNAGMTQAQAEAIFTQYLGVTKFIWLNGGFSTDDVTDMHIDGIAKFVGSSKIVTMNNANLLAWGLTQTDINTLYAATNANNQAYTFIHLPLTQNNVSTTSGTNLGYKGCYINYYVANGRVLVPNYNDPNDAVANAAIQALYPGRTVVGIDVRNLYENGGMVHCVTQQQPTATVVPINLLDFNGYFDNDKTVLKWSTASEQNNNYFNIERNTEGSLFQTIGTVKGAGNTATQLDYSFIDQMPESNKTNYYRLKQVDFDGNSTYSKVIALSKKSKSTLKISPNPAHSDLEISGIADGDFIEIYNNLGQLVKTITVFDSNNKVDISDLTSGTYVVKVVNNKQSGVVETVKFVKQ